MSRALDSLNSILKYRQAREQQKIDRSLALLDLGTRLKQQQYDREEQLQRMEIARERERDNDEIREFQKKSLDPELTKMKKEKAAIDLKIQKVALDNAISNRTESNVTKFFTGISNQHAMTDLANVARIKSQSIIPSQVFDYIENNYTGKEDLDELKTNIKNLGTKKDQKLIDEFYKKPQSQAIVNSIIKAEVAKSSTGNPDYNSFLRLFENLDKSYFANQIPYMNNLKDPIKKHNKNKDFYSEQKNIVNIKNAMEKLSRDQITKELEGTLQFTEKDQQETIEDYIPFDIRQQLLEEGFSKEDAGL